MYKLKLFLVFIVFLSACTSKSVNIYPVKILNKQLEVAFSQTEQTNIFKRMVLKVEKNDSTKPIETCPDFMTALTEGFVMSEEVNNMRVASEYQVCIQMDTLRNAVAAKESYLPKPYTALITNNLDLQVIRSSLIQKLGETAQSIKDTAFLVPETKDDSVIIDNKDWFYQFNVLATGDFNNDGKEDLMIEFIDRAKHGNYYSHSTYLLTRKMSDKYLTLLR